MGLMEEIRMKLLVVGLMFIGSLFIVASTQAQDVEKEHLEAIDKAIEAIDEATNERERQKAEENVSELQSALEDIRQQLQLSQQLQQSQQSATLGRIAVVSVECQGGCGDSTLGQLCSNLAGGIFRSNFRPIAVDCGSVDDDNPGIQCGGPGNNRCLVRLVRPEDPLSFYCDDVSGWDAQVYCLEE
jgi:hypothetical protein